MEAELNMENISACAQNSCGLDKYKDIVQLYDKDRLTGRVRKVFPITYTQAVYDGKTGASLESILAQYNNVFLQFMGTAEATRALLPKEMRRKGIQISYRNMEDEVIVEKCVNDSRTDDTHWGLSANWARIDELSLSGEISVSAKGTWIINGEDTGIKAVGPKGDNGLTPWMKTIDNKLYYSYDNQTWELASDYIAAWFRFTGTSGSSQAGNIGKIQISRDEGKTWADLSGTFTNNLHIKGYVATTSDLPSSAVQGDIYGVGPTYAESDTEHTNPIYKLFVKNENVWVDNGQFTSVAAGVVQEFGDSETEVISQSVVTSAFDKKSQWGLVNNDILNVTYTSNTATLNIPEGREIIVSYGLNKYKIIASSLAQTETIENIIGIWGIFYNLTTNKFELHLYSTFSTLNVEMLIICLFNINGELIHSESPIVINNKLHCSDSYTQSLYKNNYGVITETDKIEVVKSASTVTLTIKSGLFFISYGDCKFISINYTEDKVITKTSIDSLWWVVYNINTSSFEIYKYNERTSIPYNILIVADFFDNRILYSTSQFKFNGSLVHNDKNYDDRLELSVAAYDNFSIDTSDFPEVTLNTIGREVFIITNKREIIYKNMNTATVTKNIGGTGDWILWWLVYEPTANIYNLYTRNEQINGNIPSDALVLAVFRQKTLLYTLSNFFIDGYTTVSPR